MTSAVPGRAEDLPVGKVNGIHDKYNRYNEYDRAQDRLIKHRTPRQHADSLHMMMQGEILKHAQAVYGKTASVAHAWKQNGDMS